MPPERLGDPRYGDELVAMQLTGIGSAREGANAMAERICVALPKRSVQ